LGAATHPARPGDDLRAPAWICSQASRPVELISLLCTDLPPGMSSPTMPATFNNKMGWSDEQNLKQIEELKTKIELINRNLKKKPER